MRSALNQHQMGTDTERGLSLAWGVCRFALAAHKAQESATGFSLRCAVTLPVNLAGASVPVLFTRIPDRRAASSTAAAVSGACGLLHHASRTHSYGARLQPRSILSATGLPSDTAHSATVKPSLQFLADRYFLRHFCVLSFVPSVKSPCTEGMPSRWQSLPSQAAR
jgi:hypothetical protein